MSEISPGQSPAYFFQISWNYIFFHVFKDPLKIYFSKTFDETSVKFVYATMAWVKFHIDGLQITEKMQLQVWILNLDVFTCAALHVKLSSKFLPSTSGLIEIHMSAMKHKKTQVVYTYQLPLSRYSCGKEVFLWVWLTKYPFFSFLFIFSASILVQLLMSLNCTGEQQHFWRKLNSRENLLLKIFIKHYSLKIHWYIFSKIDNIIDFL